MALNINFNTPAITDSGTHLDIANIRLLVTIAEDGSPQATIKMEMYESLAAYNDNRMPVWVDEIPRSLGLFTSPITANQYANVDMENIHNQMRNILLHGSTEPNYPDNADQTWLGLLDIDPLTTVVVNMP